MVNQWIASLRARVHALPARALDAAIAAVVFAESTIEVVLVDIPFGDKVAGIAVAALVALGILICRDRPLPGLALGIGALCLLNLLPQALQDVSEGPFFGLLFLVYSMALRHSGRTLWAG